MNMENLKNLSQFSGSDVRYKVMFNKRIVYTEGVKALAEAAGAYWLIDLIVSHQPKVLRTSPRLQDFQLWQLSVSKGRGVATCREDSNVDPCVTQRMSTDFPLDSIKLYVERCDENAWVILLPSEH